MDEPFKLPPPYAVYCTVQPNARNGLSKVQTHRLGPADTLKAARDKITKDLRDARDTMGGLIEATSTKGRSYRIFKAVWEEVT